MAELSEEELNKRKAAILGSVVAQTADLKDRLDKWIRGETTDQEAIGSLNTRGVIISNNQELIKHIKSNTFWEKYFGKGRKSI